MAQWLAIFFGFLACLAQVQGAKDNILDDQTDLEVQPTSLLQKTFHIEGENEKDKMFSSQPLLKDSWGFDEDDSSEDDADADNDSRDMLDSENDADSDGISELQISSQRATQNTLQPAGSVSVDHEIPGMLRQAVVQSLERPSAASAPQSFAQPSSASTSAIHPAAVAGLVSTASASTEQTSRAAFGQLSALDAEFKELRDDDSSHVKQLMYTVHLREKLRDQLKTAQEQLEKDNLQLAQLTAQIIGTESQGNAEAGNQQAAPDSQQDQGIDAANGTVAAMLLQAAISSRQHRELTGQQIAAEALSHVEALMQDIAALRKRDEEEMQNLRKNVDSREALQTKIESRKAQLQTDAGALIVDLGQIRGLVEHEPAVPGDQVAQPGADVQDGQEQVPGQQPMVQSQEQMNMLQQQAQRLPR